MCGVTSVTAAAAAHRGDPWIPVRCVVMASLARIEFEGLAAERTTGNGAGAAARHVEGLATDRRT